MSDFLLEVDSCVMCDKEINLSVDEYFHDEEEGIWCPVCFHEESDTGEVF